MILENMFDKAAMEAYSGDTVSVLNVTAKAERCCGESESSYGKGGPEDPFLIDMVNLPSALIQDEDGSAVRKVPHRKTDSIENIRMDDKAYGTQPDLSAYWVK